MAPRKLEPIAAAGLALLGCAAHGGAPPQSPPAQSREQIFILRSIREVAPPVADWCAATRTGFEPFPADPERVYSFWSLRVRPDDGSVVETKAARVAELHGCFGPTSEPARQRFYAEIRLGALAVHGTGECLALGIDVPQPGLFTVRCQLVLGGTPAPYVGGVLTTNTITSKARFGGDTDPPGYTQASIATIRLWRTP